MSKVEVYMKPHCPYCHQAVDFLRQAGIEMDLHDVEKNEDDLLEMRRRVPSARTVPQIFIDDEPIGGFSDMMDLHAEGKLMPKLRG